MFEESGLMRTLFLAWQAPADRAWFPVGRLDADTASSRYRFNYTRGALSAQREGFHPVVSFPSFNESYESSELFPMFKNRVLQPRRDFPSYLASLALDRPDPIEILAVTGGERQTDSFEVFPKIEKQADDSFVCRFFLHGLRYMSEAAQHRAIRLQPEETLGVSLELNNPKHGLAIQLTSQDYEFIGWTPRFIVGDLLQAIAKTRRLTAKVIQVNSDEIPVNRRVLVEMRGYLPSDFEPMAAGDFLPIYHSNEA
jgi:hypothetical protein